MKAMSGRRPQHHLIITSNPMYNLVHLLFLSLCLPISLILSQRCPIWSSLLEGQAGVQLLGQTLLQLMHLRSSSFLSASCPPSPDYCHGIIVIKLLLNQNPQNSPKVFWFQQRYVESFEKISLRCKPACDPYLVKSPLCQLILLLCTKSLGPGMGLNSCSN